MEDSIVKHSQIKPPAEFKGIDEQKSTPVDSGAITLETNLTDGIITNNTNIVNDTAKGSAGGSNHVITSVPDVYMKLQKLWPNLLIQMPLVEL